MSTSSSKRTPGRNDPCPCGSGKKYKKCHGASEHVAGSASGAPARREGVEQRFARAYQLFQRGAFAEAAEICADILQQKPKHIHANHLLGLCRYQEGDYQGALPCLERAVSLDPADPDARTNLAMALSRLGILPDAESHARRAVELDPRAAAPQALLGKILLDMGNLSEASTILERAQRIGPDNPDVLCACGELLRAERRLQEAKQLYEKAVAVAPDSVQALNDLGLVLNELRDFDGAQASLDRARGLAPDDPDILINLGNVANSRGDIEGARQWFRRALQANERFPLAYMNLASLATQEGDWRQAELWLERGIEACPDTPTLYEQIAVLHAERQDLVRAMEALEKAVRAGGDTAQTELARAEICDRRHDPEGAAAAYMQAAELDDHNPDLLLKFADFEEQHNRYASAAQLAARAIVLDPSREPEARILAARAARRQRDYTRAEAELSGLDIDLLPTALQVEAWYELGSLRDTQGDFSSAFDAFTNGAHAAIRQGGLNFDSERAAAALQHDRDILSPEALRSLQRFEGDPGAKGKPIFVVGFLRSGTTLLEQILSSHPMVEAGDELMALPDLAYRISDEVAPDSSYPECLLHLKSESAQEVLARWRHLYLQAVRNFGLDVDHCDYFTDKLPLNILRLPLISMVFPEAPILHIRRNPMDCVLSNFVTNIGPINDWAYNLEHGAQHYREVMGMADYYRDNLPMRYHELRYEDLVTKPEPVLREIADFVDLPWDDRMLRFHESERVARTPSHAQVAQPLYTRSIGRYRHYEKYLEKPLAILEPLMRGYGEGDGN
jgi:tetratricopeptide (TPR) repeat protein